MNNPEKELRDYLNELIKRYLFITAYVNQFEILDLWDTPNRIDTLNKGRNGFCCFTICLSVKLIVSI